MSQKILITGITGFAGSHLVDYVCNNHPDTNIYGLVRCGSPKINIYNHLDRVTLIEGDLLDCYSLIDLIEDRPQYIFHLAAKTFVKYSFRNPLTSLQDNGIGTLNLLESIRFLKEKEGYDPIVHICSTSEVYGQVDQDELPITEKNIMRPMSPYAVSKACEDMYALQYFYSWNIKTIISRAFSHTGTRSNPIFAISNFCKQVAAIELGIQDPTLSVGNLNSTRTFCDVQDIMEAYWLLVTKCSAGEIYNICGNRVLKIKDVVDIITSFSSKKINIQVDKDRLRPSDTEVQIPTCDKFQQQTGWKPKIEFETTIKNLLDYWKDQLQHKRVINNV